MREFLSSRKTFVIIAAIGLVLIGALLMYGILVTPARQPYRDALTQYQNVGKALARTNVSLNTTTASDEEFKKSLETAETMLKSLETENDALAKQEVLTSGEGKARYDAYDAKIKAYIAYNRDILASIDEVRLVLRDCSAAMNTVTEDEKGLVVVKNCADKMAAVSDVPDIDYQELIDTFGRLYKDLATVFEQITALNDPKGADAKRYSELQDDRTQIMSSFSTAGDTFSSNIQTHRSQILTTDSEKALNDYLTAKSRIF